MDCTTQSPSKYILLVRLSISVCGIAMDYKIAVSSYLFVECVYNSPLLTRGMMHFANTTLENHLY